MQDDTDSIATFRAAIQHEDEQTHRRLSWLGSFQGILFAALGICWDKNSSLARVICFLGLVVALLVSIGVFLTFFALWRTRCQWLKQKPVDYKGLDTIGFFPAWARYTHFLAPELLLPLAFVIAWIAVLIIRGHLSDATHI